MSDQNRPQHSSWYLGFTHDLGRMMSASRCRASSAMTLNAPFAWVLVERQMNDRSMRRFALNPALRLFNQRLSFLGQRTVLLLFRSFGDPLSMQVSPSPGRSSDWVLAGFRTTTARSIPAIVGAEFMIIDHYDAAIWHSTRTLHEETRISEVE